MSVVSRVRLQRQMVQPITADNARIASRMAHQRACGRHRHLFLFIALTVPEIDHNYILIKCLLDPFQHPLQSNCLSAAKFNLHPLSEVFKVVQMEEWVFQPGDGPVGIEQTTHVELIAVPLVLWARGAADQRQQLFLKVVGKHGRGGAGARVWFICQTQKNNNF